MRNFRQKTLRAEIQRHAMSRAERLKLAREILVTHKLCGIGATTEAFTGDEILSGLSSVPALRALEDVYQGHIHKRIQDRVATSMHGWVHLLGIYIASHNGEYPEVPGE